LEFNVPFQHKYGYIRDEIQRFGRDGFANYAFPSLALASQTLRIVTLACKRDKTCMRKQL